MLHFIRNFNYSFIFLTCYLFLHFNYFQNPLIKYKNLNNHISLYLQIKASEQNPVSILNNFCATFKYDRPLIEFIKAETDSNGRMQHTCRITWKDFTGKVIYCNTVLIILSIKVPI